MRVRALRSAADEWTCETPSCETFGHPDRTDEEIRQWALEHDLPYFDDEVHFPDVRVEYQEADGSYDHDDLEVVTEHYRGAHGASVGQSGFITFRGSGGSVGGAPFDPSRRRR